MHAVRPGGRSPRSALIQVALGAAAIAACSKSNSSSPPPPSEKTPPTNSTPNPTPNPPPTPKASPEWYRATIGDKQGVSIPFFLQVPSTGDEAFMANGPDRVKAKLISRPPKLEVEFDILHTKITATADDKGNLDGTWASSAKAFDARWSNASVSFHAEPIAGPDPKLRFATSSDGPDPAGVWKVKLSDPDGSSTGKLTISRGVGNELTGVFSFDTGNVAFLAGLQDGKTIHMSAFDGASPYLINADLDDGAKTFKGNFIAGQALDWKEELSAEKTGDFELKLQVQMASKRPKLKLPQLAAAPYKGQPVIVELGGSWCPACGHASGKLRALRDKYAAQGLQVLTLAYEFSDDSAYNKSQAEFFKSKYQIPWDVIPVDGGTEKFGEILPPEVKGIDVSGFPITIFVARDGGIEGFHSGFPPEKWGELHQKAVDEYDRLTAKIVASKEK